MTTEQRQVLINEIRSLPDRLEESVVDLSDQQLDTPYREGGWTLRQVVHHIADSHLNGYIRMKAILTEDHPTLKPYDQDSWADLSDSRLPLQASLALVRGLHQRWCVVLENVSDEQWGRTAFHPEDGDVTLEMLLKGYSRHGKHHVGQIEGLKEREGWAN